MCGRICFFLFLFSIFPLFATEYEPWLGHIYEFEWRPSLIYQSYSPFSSQRKRAPSRDLFLDISLCNSLPNPPIGLEIQTTQAWTKKQQGDLDQLKVTGRYVVQDDIIGDPLSLTIGCSYIQAFAKSLKDISSFHHGLYEQELFLSIGRETPDETLWNSRWWGVFAAGIAEQGSPWLRFQLNYHQRHEEKHEIRGFFDSLWGLGKKKLGLSDFHGYGAVQHQSIDIGLRYTYLLKFYGSASLEYSYRIYARHFPAHAHHLLAQILYSFGL